MTSKVLLLKSEEYLFTLFFLIAKHVDIISLQRRLKKEIQIIGIIIIPRLQRMMVGRMVVVVSAVTAAAAVAVAVVVVVVVVAAAVAIIKVLWSQVTQK